MAMLTLLRRMSRHGITVHGFRSTLRDWVAECTDYPDSLAEEALAHVIVSQTVDAYTRWYNESGSKSRRAHPALSSTGKVWDSSPDQSRFLSAPRFHISVLRIPLSKFS